MSRWRHGWRHVELERVLNLEYLVLAGWLMVFAVYFAEQPITDPDTPWHIATGRYILTHHLVPTIDPFSWSMRGKPWVTQEWLFEVVLAVLTNAFGFFGAWLLVAGLHAVTVLVLYRTAALASDGNRVIAALAASAATLVGLDFWIIRPQIVSYTMFAVFLWILQWVRMGRLRVLWLVPPLMCLWSNAHASASIGILMLWLEVLISFLPSIGRLQRLVLPRGARWRLLAASAAGIAAAFINPNGYRALTYAMLSTNPLMVNNIIEWHSPDFHAPYFQHAILPFLIVVFLILLACRTSLPIRETLYFGGTFTVALIYQRFMPYVAIASVPLVVQVVRNWLRPLLYPSRLLRIVDGMALLVLSGWFISETTGLQKPLNQHLSPGAYPVAAVDYMVSHHLTQRVLNLYSWGGYLIYRGIPTFVDGRTDIFLNGSVFNDYLSLENLWYNAPELLDQYGFRVALFPPGRVIVTYLSHNPDWKVVYEDSTAEVLVRVKGASAP